MDNDNDDDGENDGDDDDDEKENKRMVASETNFQLVNNKESMNTRKNKERKEKEHTRREIEY